MKNNKKVIGLIVSLLVLLLGVAFWIFQSNDTKEVSPKGNRITFTGSELKEEQDGKVIWHVKADTVEIDSKTKAVSMNQMVGTFYRDGTTLTVTALTGTVTGDRKRIDLKGGVKAVNTEGAVFTTEEVEFDNEKKIFTSKTPFTYTNNDTSISGDALVAEMVLERITAKGNAKLIRK